jgi:hypothetical protein
MTESTQRLSDALKAAHPDVEWRRIIAFRNILVHDYLGIDTPASSGLEEKDLYRASTLYRFTPRMFRPSCSPKKLQGAIAWKFYEEDRVHGI